jgi:serine/threonine protein kinase
MSTNQARDWQGKMLGRYRLMHLLGRGGMGEVWLAEDSRLRRQIAVKILPTALTTDRDYLQDFEREARAAAALEHPNILPIHDFGEQQVAQDEIAAYLIMPYIAGGSLRDRIRNTSGPMAIDEALHYLRHAAQALDYAHGKSMLHRDIKPANMLLQNGWLFLADFGIAKLLTNSTFQARTHAGAGTPEYMAPEQAEGKAEPASDRYSFAMTAYQLFTGQLPFRGTTPFEVLMMQVRQEPPSPRQFNPALPQVIEQAILWGLAKRAADRPASCMALVEALERGWQNKARTQADQEATVLAPWSKRRQEELKPPLQKITLPGMPGVPQANAPYTPNMQLTPPAQNIAQPFAYTPQNVMTQLPPNRPFTPNTTYPTAYQVNTPTYVANASQAPVNTPQAPASNSGQRSITRRKLLVGGASAALVAAAGGTALYFYVHSFSGQTSHLPRSSHIPQLSHPTPVPGPQKLIKGQPLLSLTGHNKSVSGVAWDPTGRYLVTGSEDTHVMLWDIGSYLQKGAAGFQSIATPAHDWKLVNSI